MQTGSEEHHAAFRTAVSYTHLVPLAPSTPPKATASFAFRETSQKGLSDRDTALANLTHGLTSGVTPYGAVSYTHLDVYKRQVLLIEFSLLMALAFAYAAKRRLERI